MSVTQADNAAVERIAEAMMLADGSRAGRARYIRMARAALVLIREAK